MWSQGRTAFNSRTNYEASGARQAEYVPEKRHRWVFCSNYCLPGWSVQGHRPLCLALWSSSFPVIGNNVCLLSLLGLGAGERYPQERNWAKVLHNVRGPSTESLPFPIQMVLLRGVGGDEVLLDTLACLLWWVIPSEGPSVNVRHCQELGFIIFLGTKKFNFKSAYSSFWRNKHSTKQKYLIVNI